MSPPTTYDWSLLHISILFNIFKIFTDSEAERRRIAAVCTAWRTAISLLPAACDVTIPLPDISFSLKRFSLYILTPNPPVSGDSRVWIIRVQKPESGKWFLHNPFTPDVRRRRFTLNLLGNFRILETIKLYQLYFETRKIYGKAGVLPDWYDDSFVELALTTIPYAKKVIVISKLVLVLSEPGRLNLLFEDRWVDFESNKVYPKFKDIVSFNDEFYAIDGDGNLVKIAITTGRDNKAKPELIPVMLNSIALIRRREFPYLVTSNGDLYLVVKKTGKRNMAVVECMTYVFNKTSLKWMQVTSLKDMVFFVLEGVSFSVSAGELGWRRGNLIYLLHDYVEDACTDYEDFHSVYVYDFNDSKLTNDLVDKFPKPVFLPKPKFVTDTSDQIVDNIEDHPWFSRNGL